MSDRVDTGADAGRACRTTEDCRDEIACTAEACVDNRCHISGNDNLCDDNVFCNGGELCDLRRGCIPGPPNACSDDDVCTLDRCDETTRTCLHGPRDFDSDGDVDWNCDGGTDCADMDPFRSGQRSEICGDTIDNDCDEMIDERGCSMPMHDTCSDPLLVEASSSVLLRLTAATADFPVSCNGNVRMVDGVIRLHLDTAQDVRIRATSETSLTSVMIFSTCATTATALKCQVGFPGDLRRRALPAGDYFVVVGTSSPTGETVLVDVTLSAASPPVTNETCASPTEIAATGGTYPIPFVDIADDTALVCGNAGSPDVMYRMTLPTPMDVTLTASSGGFDFLNLEVRTDCASTSSTTRCVTGGPATTRLRSLPAGTYYVIVEGPSYASIDASLNVRFGEPTPTPPGDACAEPIVLTPGMTTLGTLVDKEDDIRVPCGFSGRDAVYSFTLSDLSDVSLNVDAGTRNTTVAISDGCAAVSGLRRCANTQGYRGELLRLPAGTYYVYVEASTALTYSITLNVRAPSTETTTVAGNETCGTAFMIPREGGVFTGTTAGFASDLRLSAFCAGGAGGPDAFYRFDLPARKRVYAAATGTGFDAILAILPSTCPAEAELACNVLDIGGPASEVGIVLDAGTYYIDVDSYSTLGGAYRLEVAFSDP